MHDALRRDLSPISIALASAPAAHERQEALAEHLEWMMSFLHVHHSNEDEKLWPLVPVRRPAASDLLDQMNADHQVTGPHIEAVQAAARRWADTGDVAAADTLSSAVLGLQLVLLPHLDRAEREVMPIVSEVFTEAQWQEWGRKAKPKMSLALDAEYFNWFLDGLDEQRAAKLRKMLPAPIVLLITTVLRGPYRRRVSRVWG